MPRTRKRGLESHNTTMTSFLERVPVETSTTPRAQVATLVEVESGELTLGLLKDILLKEIAKISNELKDITIEFKRVDV